MPSPRLFPFLASTCALLAASAAQAQAPEQPEREPSAVDMVRFDAGGLYFRGSHLVGHGTRAPHHGVAGALRLDVIRFPAERLGFEFAAAWGAATRSEMTTVVWLEAALDVAPLRWAGPWGGALLVGVGAGLEGGQHPSLDEDLRGYPLVVARFRLLPTRAVSLHAAWRFTPITSNALATRVHRLELAASVALAHFGARAELEQTTGGDPERTYGELRVGPFFGVAFY